MAGLAGQKLTTSDYEVPKAKLLAKAGEDRGECVHHAAGGSWWRTPCLDDQSF